MIHNSCNVRASYVHKVHGSAGLIKYLLQLLKEEGYETQVLEHLVGPDVESTSIFIDPSKVWEVVIYNTPATIHGGPPTLEYTLWYHEVESNKGVWIGTVNNITLVMAAISSTQVFS